MLHGSAAISLCLKLVLLAKALHAKPEGLALVAGGVSELAYSQDDEKCEKLEHFLLNKPMERNFNGFCNYLIEKNIYLN